jgi:hypothetical protein
MTRTLIIACLLAGAAIAADNLGGTNSAAWKKLSMAEKLERFETPPQEPLRLERPVKRVVRSEFVVGYVRQTSRNVYRENGRDVTNETVDIVREFPVMFQRRPAKKDLEAILGKHGKK